MKSMRRDLYERVKSAISGLKYGDCSPMVRHVDLWNRNVEFVEQEESWDRPAVFLEFGPIEWTHCRPSPTERCSMHCTAELRLHVVADTFDACANGSLPTTYFLIGMLKRALTGLCGEGFSGMVPVREMSNHDHGELVEEILVMSYRGHESF